MRIVLSPSHFFSRRGQFRRPRPVRLRRMTKSSQAPRARLSRPSARKDSMAACEATAMERKLAGAARTSFVTKCARDAAGT